MHIFKQLFCCPKLVYVHQLCAQRYMCYYPCLRRIHSIPEYGRHKSIPRPPRCCYRWNPRVPYSSRVCDAATRTRNFGRVPSVFILASVRVHTCTSVGQADQDCTRGMRVYIAAHSGPPMPPNKCYNVITAITMNCNW